MQRQTTTKVSPSGRAEDAAKVLVFVFFIFFIFFFIIFLSSIFFCFDRTNNPRATQRPAYFYCSGKNKPAQASASIFFQSHFLFSNRNGSVKGSSCWN